MYVIIDGWQPIEEHLMDDADLAGPLFFCLAFGVFLLLTGKVSFSIRLLLSIYPAIINEEDMHHRLSSVCFPSRALPRASSRLISRNAVHLLLHYQVHFGYIYGFGVSGAMALYVVLNLLSAQEIDMWRVCSILGYCLLPVIGLAFLGIVISLKSTFGTWSEAQPSIPKTFRQSSEHWRPCM